MLQLLILTASDVPDFSGNWSGTLGSALEIDKGASESVGGFTHKSSLL